MSKKTIGIIVGSLRKASYSKKIATALIAIAPGDFEFKVIPIGDLPLYNQDFDDHNEAPASYPIFREMIKALDGVIFVTPEYNRSLPAVLKNALDVASRPYGKNCWQGKPAAIISISVGNISGFGANHHLRQCLVFLDVPVMQQPEAYLANIQDSIDENGNTSERTSSFLKKFIDAYINWFNKF